MAGDWIKMRADLHTHPKVVRMASALKADRLRIVGGLHSAWCLFDVHSVDGFLDGYSADTLDDLIGFPGFSRAMMAVGWLEENGESLVMPRFEAHNGQSAKRRAQDADRKRNVRKASASEADKKRTREEKRREDINKTPLSAREEIQISPVVVPGIGEPIGKFTMHENWQPSDDFVMRARMWGHALPAEGYKKSDLIEFITYWMAEGNVMQHVQWEQKFARLLMNRKKRAAGKRGESSDDEVPHWNSPEGWKDFL